MDGGRNDFGIPVFSGEPPGKIEIIGPHDFDIPCVGLQFGGDVDFPESVAVTDSRKNSSGERVLEDQGHLVSNNFYGHAILSALCLPLRRDPIAGCKFQGCIIGDCLADDAISNLQFTVVQ